MSLQGRSALVAGAGGGIGSAVAKGLAAEGAEIVCVDQDKSSAEDAARGVAELGRSALALAGDLSRGDQVDQIVDEAHSVLGKIDILVNCVGIGVAEFVADHDEETWDRVMAVNLKSAFLLCRRVLPRMTETGSGRIINITSRSAYQSSAGTAAYAASKAGLLAFSRVLAAEAGSSGITVNTVAPGTTLTPMTDDYYGGPEERKVHAERTGVVLEPFRFAHASEIAAAVVYLSGPNAEHVTGATLHVNGGSYMP